MFCFIVTIHLKQNIWCMQLSSMLNIFNLNSLKMTIFALAIVSFDVSAYSRANLFYHSLDNEFFGCFDKCIKNMGKQKGVSFMTHDAKFNYHTQLTQVTNDITEAQASIVVTSDNIVAKEALERSRDQNLPIVFFNRKPPVSYRSYQKAWFVGTNGTQAGHMQAKMILDYYKKKGSFDTNKNERVDFIILRGEKGNTDTTERTLALVSDLLGSGLELNPISDNYSDWDFQKAYKDMTTQIKKNGIENIELVIANNDDMALGAIKALQEIGYNSGDTSKTIPVFGVDGVSSAIKAIKAGYMTGTVFADTAVLAGICIHIVNNFDITEKELSSLIYVPISNHTIIVPYKPYANFINYRNPKLLKTDYD